MSCDGLFANETRKNPVGVRGSAGDSREPCPCPAFTSGVASDKGGVRGAGHSLWFHHARGLVGVIGVTKRIFTGGKSARWGGSRGGKSQNILSTRRLWEATRVPVLRG